MAAGTYNESITINKSLTLKGAQVGVDPTQGTRSPVDPTIESIINGEWSQTSLVWITASDVVFDGFTVENGSFPSPWWGIGGGLVHAGPTALTNLKIRNNIIMNGENYHAIRLLGVSNSIIENNLIENILDAHGIEVGGHNNFWHPPGDNNFIRNNYITNVGLTGIVPCGYAASTVIEGNTVVNSNLDGIALWYHVDNTIIRNNLLENLVNTGIVVYNSSNAIIENNRIENNQRRGIRLSNDSSNNTIRYNTITGNLAGIYFLREGVSDLPFEGLFTGKNTQIGYNNIYGNVDYGVLNESANVVNARNNYWGDPSGPYHPTSNPDGQGDNVSDHVEFKPWLDAPYPGGNPVVFIAIWPENGPVGTEVSVTGGFFTQGGMVCICFDNKIVAKTTANEDGDIEITFFVPVASVGPHEVRGYDVYTDNWTTSVIFTITIIEPEIEIDPDKGPVGTEVEVTGEGFTLRGRVTIYFDKNGNHRLEPNERVAGTRADEIGSIKKTFIVPRVPYGVYFLWVVDATTGEYARAAFIVEPKIILRPNRGFPGQRIFIRGTGFTATSEIEIYWKDEPEPMPTRPIKVITRADGSFRAIIRVPPVELDSYKITAIDGYWNSASEDLMVIRRPR